MQLRNVTNRNIKTNIKNISIGDNGIISNYTPSFVKGDVVTIKKSAISISSTHSKLVGKLCIIEDCKLSDLEDVLVEIVRLKQTKEDKDNRIIINPYLAEYFEKAL